MSDDTTVVDLFKLIPILDAQIKEVDNEISEKLRCRKEMEERLTKTKGEINKRLTVGKNHPRRIVDLGDGMIGIVEWHGGGLSEYVTVEVVRPEIDQ